MKFIPHISRFESPKNGTIILKEFLWWNVLYAGGFEQSGPYVVGLWSKAFRTIPNNQHVQSVLVIGLGLGDNVRIAQKYFPDANLTVVEWDSVIITLARKISHFPETVQIIEGDLRDALPMLPGPYDLILSDAFFGDRPDVGMDTKVGESFSRLLSQKGLLILNASRTPAAIEYVSRFLTLKQKIQYKDNTVAVFGKN